MSKSSATPSYGELAALVAQQAAQLTEQALLIESMRVELAALRQVGRDSSNSSQPPSTDGPAAKAKARADKRSADQTAEQTAGQESWDGQQPAGEPDKPKLKQGGQPGHRGSGLARVAKPDRSEPVEPPACGGCGADLTGAPGRIASSVQVFDLPTFALAVTEYLMMRRTCGCGHVTTADRRRGCGAGRPATGRT